MSNCDKRRQTEDSLYTEDHLSNSCTPQSKLTKQWSKEEDDAVISFVGCYGPQRWSVMASNLPGRAKSGKQCRERWNNQLDPNIKKEGWTDEEDLVIIKAHSEVAICSVLFNFQFSFQFQRLYLRFLTRCPLAWEPLGGDIASTSRPFRQ
jgi:hypothetical protein